MTKDDDPLMLHYARELSSRVETPFYFFDIEGIRQRIRDFAAVWRAHFPGAILAYSYKTNPIAAITTIFRKEGGRAEVVSEKELLWALADGYPGSQIHFNGPAKSTEALRRAMEADAAIHIDSLDELDLIFKLQVDCRPRIVLRASHLLASGERSRFGLLPDECHLALDRLENTGLSADGIHFHLGSNINSTAKYMQSISDNAPLLDRLLAQAPAGRKVSLDIGGGFPSRSASDVKIIPIDTFAKDTLRTLRNHNINPTDLTMIVEPGRCLVEEAALLATRVMARKTRAGRHLVFVDAGLDLVRSAGAMHHRVWFESERFEQHHTPYEVCGARCYEADRMPTAAVGPQDVKIGSMVFISSAGAYALVQAGVWNGLCARIYGVDGSKVFELGRDGRLPELISTPS
ncbi:MAG: hypothetical protein E6G97_21895 [Alphaproteobacteria bacterium]|nr:MAG: hypothetical protein E6G97_21895 [Alphaproteobacteria bacterium]